MEDNRLEQIEALQALVEYSPKLLNGLKSIAEELQGHRQPDTDEFLLTVIKGMNWEIQVLNGSMSLLNEKEILIDKEKANQLFVEFSGAYQRKNDADIARIVENQLTPFFEQLEKAAKSKIAER